MAALPLHDDHLNVQNVQNKCREATESHKPYASNRIMLYCLQVQISRNPKERKSANVPKARPAVIYHHTNV